MKAKVKEQENRLAVHETASDDSSSKNDVEPAGEIEKLSPISKRKRALDADTQLPDSDSETGEKVSKKRKSSDDDTSMPWNSSEDFFADMYSYGGRKRGG